MTSIKYRLENGLHHFGKGETTDGIATVENVVPIIQLAIQEVRRISMDLRPSILDDIGILATIEWYCREFHNTYQGIRVTHHVDVHEDEIDENLKLVMCRVVQEALHNIARHSYANLVWVELRHSGRRLVLCVRDNGVGFASQRLNAGESSGFGLRSMRERVEQSQGEFVVSSRPGMGTSIEASWPLLNATSVCDQSVLHRVHG